MTGRAIGAGIEVIGHRGARGLFPENTLEGFRSAWALGIRSFELDVGLTRDGIAVVAHDPALNPDLTRNSVGQWLDGPGPLIHALRAADLAAYDVGRIRAGSRTAALFPRQRPWDGARVPTLAAVLAAVPEARLIIEIKTDPLHPNRTAAPAEIADAVLGVVDQADAAERVVVESFDWRVQQHIRRVRPDIRLAFLTSADALPDFWWGGVMPAQHGGSTPACIAALGGAGAAWAPLHSDLTEAAVQHAHALGIVVLPWTVNRPEEIRRLIAWGVDGIISDYPDLLAAMVPEEASG
jgi:glycerophosphoryl diester phosphodiesterase